MKSLTPKQLALKVAALAEDKKALEITILEMKGLVNFCDYFVIASGTSDRQVKAIAEGIDDGLAALGLKLNLTKNIKVAPPVPNPHEGEGAWVLLDLGDVVVHVFEPQSREFYGLEHLWQDAPKLDYKPKAKAKSKTKS